MLRAIAVLDRSLAPPVLAVAALLAGCTLFEVQPEVQLTVWTQGPTRAATIAVQVSSKVGERAAVFVDGARRGEVDVGGVGEVDVSGIADGEHDVTAEVRDQGRTLRAGGGRFLLDRTAPAPVSIDPPPGVLPPYDENSGTFEVAVVFSEPVTDLGPYFGDPFSFIGTSTDRRTLRYRVRAQEPSLRPTVRDDAGNDASLDALWTRQDLALTLLDPDLSKPLRGVVTVRATFAAPSAEARLGSLTATLLPGIPATFDTRLLSDGRSELSFQATRYTSVLRDVVIDNTAPWLLRCGPATPVPSSDLIRHPVDDAWVGDSIFAEVDEPAGRPGDVTLARTVDLTGPMSPAALPFTWSELPPEILDAAGNSLALGSACQATFPAWNRPLGDGVFAPAAGSLRAWSFHQPGAREYARLAWTVAGSHGDRVFSGRGSTPPYWTDLGVPVTGVRGVPRGLAWVTATLDGTGLVLTADERSAGVAITLDPLPLQAAPVRAEALSPSAVAWTMAGPGGARELRAVWLPDRWTRPPPPATAPLVTSEPEGTPLAAAMSSTRPRIAYVQAAPGLAATLLERSATPALDGFLPVIGPLNANSALDASEPAVESTDQTDLLAWLEGGRVHVRVRAAGETYAEPVTLGEDPSATSRGLALSPSPLGPVLSFIESGPSGDRLLAYRFVESGPGAGSWTGLPTPETGNTLLEASVSWPAVLWRDGAGDLRYRRYNE